MIEGNTTLLYELGVTSTFKTLNDNYHILSYLLSKVNKCYI